MKIVVTLHPKPDSNLRLEGQAPTLLGAIDALNATVIEYGSMPLTAEWAGNLASVQAKAVKLADAHPADLIHAAVAIVRDHYEELRCRVCGCTDLNCSECIEATGGPCHWIKEMGGEPPEGPICSRCHHV